MDLKVELIKAKQVIERIYLDKDKLTKPYILFSFIIAPIISLFFLRYHNLINTVLLASLIYWFSIFLWYQKAIPNNQSKPKKELVIEADYQEKQ